MRFKIEANPPGPIRILRELPAARLAILEGLNGIGKTLAVRLLETCTGRIPYNRDSAAWKSLCDALGEFSVTVTGLTGASEVRWIADTRDWTDPSGTDPSYVPFRSLTIDGTEATVADVRRLLAVHRVGGEEGMIETFSRYADSEAEIVRSWTRRYADQVGGPLLRLEASASEALDLLGSWTLAEYRALTASSEDARTSIARARQKVRESTRQRDDLFQAREIRDRLSLLRERAPDLAAHLNAIDEEIVRVQALREQVQSKVQQLAREVAVSAPAAKELRNARRTTDRNRENLGYYLSNAAINAAALGITPDVATVEATIRKLSDTATGIEAARLALHSGLSMGDVLQNLDAELARAERQHLSDQVAFQDSAGQLHLTVSELRQGVLSRRSYVEAQPPPPELQELDKHLDDVNRALTRARRVEVLLEEAARSERLVAQNEDRVRRALEVINPNASAQLESLEQQRRDHEARLLQMAAERAGLRQQLGIEGDGVSESTLEAQLKQTLQVMGVAEAELDSALTSAENTLVSAQLDLARSDELGDKVRRELLRAHADIRDAVVRLIDDPRLEWVREALGASVATSDAAPPQDQLGAVDVARSAITLTGDRLGDIRGQLGAIESAARGVARHLRGEDPLTARYLPELELWFGAYFSDWLNNPRIRHELLPDASSNLAVDVQNREVLWSEGAVRRSRPLEAFSSGEQAFAYTRARLAALDEEHIKPANRLIVLDEFGAFIAYERLTSLLTHLQERVGHDSNDQILIVLPLSRDYGELADNAFGPEAERYADLASQILDRGYAVRILEP